MSLPSHALPLLLPDLRARHRRLIGIPLVLVTAVLIASVAPRDAAAQVDVLWLFQGIANINAMAEVPDADMDGVPDIAVETYNSGAGTADHLYLLSGGSTNVPAVIWSIRPVGGPSSSGGWGDDCLNAAPDLSGDGFPDLVLGTAWGGRSAYGINGRTGDVLWTFDTYADSPPTPPRSGWVYTIRSVPDLDDDQVSDVVFGCGSDNDGTYAVSGATGDVIYRLETLDAVFASAVVGDVDGDGLAEVVFGAGENDDRLYCVRGSSNGAANNLWIATPGATIWHVTGFADVNGDTKNDVVAALWASAGQVRCFSGLDGSQIWAYTTGASDYGMRVVPIDDVNGDFVPDIAVASWDNAVHVVSGADGLGIWRSQVGTLNGGDVWAVDRVDDVTGDGISDVIGGSFDNFAYLFDGVTGDQVWSTSVGARVYSVRGVSDISGNGIPDVVVGTQMLSGQGGEVWALEGNTTSGVEILAEVTAQPVRAGVEVSWPVARFVPGTTFNLHRRQVAGPGETGQGVDERMQILKVALTQSDLPARQIKEMAVAMREENPFQRLNDQPIEADGGEARYLDQSAVPGARYEYRVGWIEPGLEVERFLYPVAATAPGATRVALRLGLPTPQPAQGQVQLDLEVMAGRTVDVTVYGIDGRVVRRLVEASSDLEGVERLRWDGRDDAGGTLPAGIYLVTAASGSLKASQKVILVP
jgi:hypothetical protein